MLRKVYLEGELGHKYGQVLEVCAESVGEVIAFLDANFDGVKKYFIDSGDRNVEFTVKIADNYVEDDRELILPLDKGDIVITPVPVGSSGALKTIIGVIMVVASFLIDPSGGLATFLTKALFAGGIMLASMGIAEMMMPDPDTDNTEENKDGYLFQGAEQTTPEGYPVPILYGELRVPGQPITFDLVNKGTPDQSIQNANGTYASVPDERGNIIRKPSVAIEI